MQKGRNVCMCGGGMRLNEGWINEVNTAWIE